MKKNIIKVTLVAVFAVIAWYNVYSSQKAERLSDLALANVEALADGGESGGSKIYCCGNYGICMKVMDIYGNISDVAGIKFSTPCP